MESGRSGGMTTQMRTVPRRPGSTAQVSISNADVLLVNQPFTLRVWHVLAIAMLAAAGGVMGGAIAFGTDEPSRVASSVKPDPANKATLDREQAQSNVRSSIPAIEAYAADRPSAGYSGMTVAGLRVIDAGIADVDIVRADFDTYCVEGTVGGQTASFSRPADELVLAAC
jgi:hypothetical protein